LQDHASTQEEPLTDVKNTPSESS